MKKLIKIIPIIVIVTVVFVVGLVRREKLTTKDISSESETSEEIKPNSEADNTQKNDEIPDTSNPDEAKEDKSNLYSMDDGYISYGEFGFEIKKVRMFETDRDFMDSEYYELANCELCDSYLPDGEDFVIPGCQRYIYVELELTNESKTDERDYNPTALELHYVNEKGFTYNRVKDDIEDRLDFIKENNLNYDVNDTYERVDTGFIWFNEMDNYYNYKNHQQPVMQPEEKVLIKILYRCNYIKDYKERTEDDVYKAWDELYDGEWYIAIPPITNNSRDRVNPSDYRNIEDTRLIFIKLNVDNIS